MRYITVVLIRSTEETKNIQGERRDFKGEPLGKIVRILFS